MESSTIRTPFCVTFSSIPHNPSPHMNIFTTSLFCRNSSITDLFQNHLSFVRYTYRPLLARSVVLDVHVSKDSTTHGSHKFVNVPPVTPIVTLLVTPLPHILYRSLFVLLRPPHRRRISGDVPKTERFHLYPFLLYLKKNYLSGKIYFLKTKKDPVVCIQD